MLSWKEYLRNVVGAGLFTGAIIFSTGYYMWTYLPGLLARDLSQQVTIIPTFIIATLYCLVLLGVFLASLIYERPGQRQGK